MLRFDLLVLDDLCVGMLSVAMLSCLRFLFAIS
jgi:hypothetical protein